MLLKFHKKFHFKGSSQDLRNLMRKSGILESHKNEQLKFLSHKSYGTIMVKGAPGFFDGIYLKVKMTEKDANNTIVEFKAPLRTDHIFYILIFLFFLIGILTNYNEDSKTGLLFLLVLWPVVHLWFHVVFRFQEKWLMESITEDYRCTEI